LHPNNSEALTCAAAPSPENRERTVLAAGVIALMAGLYSGLSIFYFYEDFFKFIEPGFNAFATDRSGVSVHIEGTLWSVLSPWRLVLTGATLLLLSMSAIRLMRGSRDGKALTMFTLWGVMLPQVFWWTEFVVDWHSGSGLVAIILAAPLIVMVPTALLYEGSKTLQSWSPRCASPGRVLGTAIALGWTGFFAMECLDHSYQMSGNASFAGALLALGFSALGAYGLLRFRAWALPVAAFAVFAFAFIPLGFESQAYLASGGYIDAFVTSSMGGCGAKLVTALVPAIAVYWIAGPYLRKFGRHLFAR